VSRGPRLLASAIAAALALTAAAQATLARYGPPTRVGTITSPAIQEVSGFVASHRLPGGWWAVNDSGNAPQLHALSTRGRLVASLAVTGAANRDWEDLAAAPTPGGRALYIGDIGDNNLVRNDLVVYRVREPTTTRRVTARAEALPFRYPDGRHNAEALFVDPRSGRIYVITKELRHARVYRFPSPLRPGRRVVLERVGGEGARQLGRLAPVTGAAISPDGARVAVRTYWEALELRRGGGRSFESGFSQVEDVRLAPERQGEAIAYSRDGRSLVTTSEVLPAPIWRLTRRG